MRYRYKYWGKQVFDLIAIELMEVRKMAQQAGEYLLVYLIDIAIIEAKAKACSGSNSLEALIPLSLENNASILASKAGG
jgi:hypothetical protein